VVDVIVIHAGEATSLLWQSTNAEHLRVPPQWPQTRPFL
jgi:hypothetical protein